jgi:hypothetical protein
LNLVRSHQSSITSQLFILILHGPNIKHRFQQNVFANPLLRNGLHNPVLLLLRACMLRVFPSNGRYLQSHRLATGLHAKISLNDLDANLFANFLSPPAKEEILGVARADQYNFGVNQINWNPAQNAAPKIKYDFP